LFESDSRILIANSSARTDSRAAFSGWAAAAGGGEAKFLRKTHTYVCTFIAGKAADAGNSDTGDDERII